MPDEPKTGELNKQFNFYVNRPFYIQSQLGSQRYLSVINGKNVVIKTPNGMKYQTWYFDQTSKTVKNKDGNKSFDIASSGKSKTMQVWSTNSGWW